MRTGWIAPLALTLALLSPADAAGNSGRVDDVRSLAASCRVFDAGATVKSRRNSDRASADAILCVGYMQAMQAVVVLADEQGQRACGACLPEDTTLGELIHVFLTYAKKHRKESDRNAAVAVLKSLQGAFPCRSADVSAACRAGSRLGDPGGLACVSVN